MTPLVFLGVAIAGGLGAGARLVVDGVVRAKVGAGFPWGTMLVNLLGSFVLGFLTEHSLAGHLSEELRLVLGTGVLGGFTTFSTASYETVRLAQQGRYRAAFANGVGMLVLAVAAALAGIALARAV